MSGKQVSPATVTVYNLVLLALVNRNILLTLGWPGVLAVLLSLAAQHVR